MKVRAVGEVPCRRVEDPGADGVELRTLIDAASGAPGFAMRLFTVAPGGHTPFHAHAWEHEVFIRRGRGALVAERGETPFREGDAVFVPGGERHQFRNGGPEPLEFICCVPLSGHCG